MQFTIFGAGALGTILAAHLLRSKKKVRVVARGERARYLEATGLTVFGLVDLAEQCCVVEKVSKGLDEDILIFTVKTYQMEKAMLVSREISPRVVFSLANGIKKNEQLRQTFPKSKILGCMANFSGELFPNGLVEFTRNVSLNIDGSDRDGIEVAQTINESGVVTVADRDIDSTEWSKFVGWVSLFVMSVIARTPTGQYLSVREFARYVFLIIKEMSQVAAQKQIELRDDTILPVASLSRMSFDAGVTELMQIGETLKTSAPHHRMSSLQDLESGRQLEVHETLGYVIEIASSYSLDLKVIPLFYDLVAGLNRINQKKIDESSVGHTVLD